MADQVIERSAALHGEALPSPSSLAAPAARLVSVSSSVWAAIALAASLAAVVAVHLPVLGHYFFGDDFVPLADIESRSTFDYIRDLFLLHDLTPNWRFLPGLFYLGAHRAFGLNPVPYLLASVIVHSATVALLFWFVRRVTDAVWPAFLAATFFGLSAAHATTVGQVTAFNNVMAGFFLVASLVAIYEGLERDQVGWWLPVSVVSFAAAVASNDASAVLAPVPALLVLWKAPRGDAWWQDTREWTRVVLLAAPFAVVGSAALIGLGACRCTDATKVFSGDPNLLSANLWIYLGRLLYPIGMEFPGNVGSAHLAAGIAAAVVAIAMLIRGPTLARISVVFLGLVLLPYLPIKFALAPRYVYGASIPFSILAALVFTEAVRLGRRLTPALPAALALVAFGVLGVYSWQTWVQNQVIERASDDWRTLITGLEDRAPDPPDGSRVYVRGGPITGELPQFVVLPAVGELLWGKVELFSVPEGTSLFCIRPGDPLYVVDFDGGRFTPVTVIESSKTVPLGSPVSPYTFPPPTPPVCDGHVLVP